MTTKAYQQVVVVYILPGIPGASCDQRDTIQTRARYRAGETPRQLGERMLKQLVANGRTAGGTIESIHVTPWKLEQNA